MSLALALKAEGCEVVFLSRKHPGNILEIIKKEFCVEALFSEIIKSTEIKDYEYESWLGASLDREVLETNNIIKKYGGFNFMVIDHYSLDYRYEAQVDISRKLVIDDLMNRKHHSDYILDQNLSADIYRYRQLSFKKKCEILAGPKYALLKPEFHNLRLKIDSDIKDQPFGILVFFGTSDLTRECRKVVDAYSSIDGEFKIKLILSREHQDFNYIQGVARSNPQIEIVEFEENMAEAILRAEVCFGSCGSSVWERACLGTPSFLISSAKNQEEVLTPIIENEICHFVGKGMETKVSDWVEVFKKVKDAKYLNELARNSLKYCDGLGVNRVIKYIVNGGDK
jgi:UDP-2,4-diacetamido-2,4,6-trideoxy-beta-L-altropyranose hydrolase